MCCCFCNNSNNEEEKEDEEEEDEEEEDGEWGKWQQEIFFCARESLLCWRRNTAPLTASVFFNPSWVCQSTVINLLVKL
jgi:hypothetical protein